MLENEDIHGAILAIMEFLRMQGTSLSRLNDYQKVYNVFERYLSDNCISRIDENICLEYVYVKTGQRFERFECVTSSARVDYHMRPMLLLLRYLQDGQFHSDVRKTKPSFVCPACFKSEYETFCEELAYRGYSEATIESTTRKVQFLIMFMAAKEVTSSADITIRHIENYLKTLENNAISYVGVFLYVFRIFFSFLYERGYIADDLAPKLPKVRTPHNASIPYVWSKDDIKRLLCAIDRADPKGKRDYAILLIAIRLGLRIGDIRSLKKSSIDWNRKKINLNMAKTGQPIELPLLKDIGWAIIDYLQNGRPTTNSECLFVRHKAPFNAFGGRNSFNKELHRYILKAGLNVPGGLLHGMHSLRSTLAGNMLEIKSPLPIISEVLGHQSVNTTSIYLKIDIEGLRKCALDPEEVFANENSL
ncbi:MAG: tyrosine-type recombinase/integrase [Proteobacteria bacterium]|nr:tyrosine-type recombinase/integrase [Pseudomonadota bacterium]